MQNYPVCLVFFLNEADASSPELLSYILPIQFLFSTGCLIVVEFCLFEVFVCSFLQSLLHEYDLALHQKPLECLSFTLSASG